MQNWCHGHKHWVTASEEEQCPLNSTYYLLLLYTE
jgi:hypothetical protein